MTDANIYDYNFDSIQIGLASPETIVKWSRGEVRKPETINYRTLKPEKDGLFCERIFGPMKDGECHCGKYKKNRYRGIVCDKCGVEVTSSKVRRTRMGHIQLAAPVSHIWFFRGIPSRMGLILDMAPRALEKVLYFAAYVVTDPGTTALEYKQVMSEREYREAVEAYGHTRFTAEMGAEAVQKLLQEVNLDTLAVELREEIDNLTQAEKDKGGQTISQKKMRLLKRLEVVQSFKRSNNKPEWMILSAIPVLPPDLRPMVQLDGGRFATSDLNDLYRRVINRNNRLRRLQELRAPDIIVRNEKRMLQEAVDALLDNGRRGRPVTGPGTRPLKSLSDMLRGKQGRFRQNLLGKRVDYSGRSVIVVGPELKIYQCGLPKEMALELFKPFVMRKLVNDGKAPNIKSARKMVDRVRPEVWDILEEIIKEHPVLLNRAPTLHRLGIQAFEPILVEGRALKLHPLVCTAYNADFDGDQMAIHVPLSAEAQAEARVLMLSANNLLAPKDGKPITVPTQDMVLGSYYLTLVKNKDYTDALIFSSQDEAKLAYDLGKINLHTPIIVRREGEFNSEPIHQRIETTMGKLIFNEAIPQDLGFVDRSKRENALVLEIDRLVKKGTLEQILDRCVKVHGTTKTAEVLDMIKSLGYKYSTKGAITVGVEDIIVPPEKEELIRETEKIVDRITREYRRGLITDDERYNNIIRAWTQAIDKLTAILKANMGEFNPINMMSDSGARGNINQIKQLAGMRGLMSDTSGKTIEIPIKANFREGLDVLEFFISSHGTRKTLSDTALRTADSGYLTRRLVDVSQEVIIRENDCGSDEYIEVSAIANSEAKDQPPLVPLAARIAGRYPAEDIINPQTGEIMAHKNELIDDDTADMIEAVGVTTVRIRSVLTCKSKHGVCSKCYGSNLATHGVCNIGEAVGIIAAQSIGEPGTQLTMRTFHTGGVATADDITQGLPRVEELFEARKPKGNATIADIAGVISITENGKKRDVTVTGDDNAQVTYSFPSGLVLKVEDGDRVEAGDMIVGGSVNPQDIIRVLGVTGVQNYIIEEVQKVYNLQGVKINDRHIEVIVRQMLRKIRIDDPGDTDLLPGSIVEILEFNEWNERMRESNKREATGERALLGITKASLATESFLSAASFQETTRVLTEAAIKCKRDPLLGLKENVIIGKLIPAGTGMSRYRDIDIDVSVLDHKPEALVAMERAALGISDDAEMADAKANISEDDSVEDSQAYDQVDGNLDLNAPESTETEDSLFIEEDEADEADEKDAEEYLDDSVSPDDEV